MAQNSPPGSACNHCGALLAASGDSFCASCGMAQNPPRQVVCANCGAAVAPNDVFCVKCGTATQPGVATLPAPTLSGTQLHSGFVCPFCHTHAPPITRKAISTAGWVIFVILLLACFIVSPLAFLIRDEIRVCSSCGVRLGTT